MCLDHMMRRVLEIFGILTLVTSTSGCAVCNSNLVTGTYGVPDYKLTASSTARDCPTRLGRLTSSRSWCPNGQGEGHYLQVEFQNVSRLTAVQTRGRADLDQWVSLYSVNTSMDGISWSAVLNTVFPGNNDRDTIVTNQLEGNVVGKYIRVISEPGSGNHYRSMRLEVQGCPVSLLTNSCDKWAAQRGSGGDMLPVMVDTDASNIGVCGLECRNRLECDAFLFDAGSARCKLLKVTPDQSYPAVNLHGVWYFVKT
ncbi:inactive carboxypeptidase-like protein X2 isoform X2 [Argopecten irradians]|uniref:inactive carboxypeptidase-like protein X2 isoform X2 n=1 Tax=Argopecten irradians TaxID=31199 RepID=UPI0037239DAE